MPTGLEQSLSSIAIANLGAGISRQDTGLISTSTAINQMIVESRNRPGNSVSLKRPIQPSLHPLISVPIRQIKRKSGAARNGVDAIEGISAKRTKTKIPQSRGEKLGKFPEDIIIREKTTGEGSLAKVGSIVDVYHQFRDHNGTVFFRQLKGEPVSSLPTIIFVRLNPACRLQYTFKVGSGQVIPGTSLGSGL